MYSIHLIQLLIIIEYSYLFVGGKTEAEKVLVDMMADNAMDFRNAAVRLFYNPKFVSLPLIQTDKLCSIFRKTGLWTVISN